MERGPSVDTGHDTHVEVRGQPAGVSSLGSKCLYLLTPLTSEI